MSDFCSFTRRGFLIGAGSLITTGFMRKVDRHVSKLDEPLLTPVPNPTIDLYFTPIPDGEGHCTLSFGPLSFELPPAPTWRQNFARQGRHFTKLSDYRDVYWEKGLRPRHLDEPLDRRNWQMIWDAFESPSARVYDALKDLDLGPDLTGDDDTSPSLEFNSGANPCSCEQWVEATDLRAVSLLQARLIELGQPYRLVRGD